MANFPQLQAQWLSARRWAWRESSSDSMTCGDNYRKNTSETKGFCHPNMTGWWLSPTSSVGMMIIPDWMESHKSHVPNHQADEFSMVFLQVKTRIIHFDRPFLMPRHRRDSPGKGFMPADCAWVTAPWWRHCVAPRIATSCQHELVIYSSSIRYLWWLMTVRDLPIVSRINNLWLLIYD